MIPPVIFISSPYLKEAYKFLEKVFDNLRTIQMRDQLIKDVYFGAYQHIGFSFMEKIIDERIISVNMGALHQMSLGMVPKLPSVKTGPWDSVRECRSQNIGPSIPCSTYRLLEPVFGLGFPNYSLMPLRNVFFGVDHKIKHFA